MAAVKWSAATERTTGIAGVTVNTGAGSLGSEIDNSVNKDRFLNLELQFQHGTGPTANSEWFVYVLYAPDGTNYEEGGASVQPKKWHVASFPVFADTLAHRVARANLPLAPHKFKLLLWNGTNQNSSANAVTLKAWTHNEDLP